MVLLIAFPEEEKKLGEKSSSFVNIPSVESMTALTEESTHQEFLTATNYKINLCVIFGCIFLPPNFFCRENIQNRAFGVGGYPEFLTAWKPLLDVLAIPPDNSNQIHLMISIDECVNVKYVSRPVPDPP